MSVQTLLSPTLTSTVDETHIVCCDDNVAMCGADVTGTPWVESDDVCPLCELVEDEDLPCPVPGCDP
jgi:hypothetical protein